LGSEVTKIDLDSDLIKSLEKALLRAKAGKIKAFAAIYNLVSNDCCEVLDVPKGQEVCMSGLTAILHRDVVHKMPVWEDFQEDAG
jgi:hypothetical protein